MSNGPVPYNLRPKSTKLPAGHDDTLDPPDPPTDPEVRGVADLDWPAQDHSIGGHGPPDAPLAPPGTDPARRSVPAFVWARDLPAHTPNRSMRETLPFIGALDPDIAMWPAVIVNIWPFSGPPTEGIWPVGWFGLDSVGQPWVCTTAGEPGVWTALGLSSAGVASFNTRTGVVTFVLADAETIFTAAGQLLAGTGLGTGELLGVGTAGQVLTVGGADPSGLEWAAPATGVASFDTRTGAVVFLLSDAERIFTAEGQLLAGTGAGTGELLAIGSAGEVLTVGGADPSGLEWKAPTPGGVTSFDTRTGAVVFLLSDAETIFTAKGQLLAGTGSGTGDLVSTGSAGQVLTVGGADASGLEWATPATGSITVASTPFTSNAYTLALGDADSAQQASNGATAATITVPANASVAFPVGTIISITQTGTGKIQVAAAGGVTIQSSVPGGFTSGTTGCRVEFSTIGLLKTATDTWVLSGDLQ